MKVVDASSIIGFLTGSSDSRALAPLLDDDLFAPDLMMAEVHRYLTGLERRQLASLTELQRCVEQLHTAPIEYLPVWPYAAQMWEWRHNITAYDACYVALAADLGCPLLTTDQRLARAANGLVPVITPATARGC